MNNANNNRVTVDNFLKSKSGQDNYDNEIARLQENRIRLGQWQKESAKRLAAKNKRKNDFL